MPDLVGVVGGKSAKALGALGITTIEELLDAGLNRDQVAAAIGVKPFSLYRWTARHAPHLQDRLRAAPPPKPINIAGPPNTTIGVPSGNGFLLMFCSRILPMPPAIMIGLW